MNIAGIDGCRKGWTMVSFVNQKYSLQIYEGFKQLITKNQHLDRILIDMPIGLSSKNFPRTIEAMMRKELENRFATVFNVPCRAAVYELDNEKARLLNQEIEQKSLSVQSLNIKSKIREVDEILCAKTTNIHLIESHPELSFKYLNNAVVQSKKSTQEGIEERLQIIGQYEPALVSFFHKHEKLIKRKDAKKDDILDAICLCLVNKLSLDSSLSFFMDENFMDEKGIEMKIGYYKILAI